MRGGGALLIAWVASLVASSLGRSPRAPRLPRLPGAPPGLRGLADPRAYGRSKLSLLRARLADPQVHEALTTWGARLLPGAPLTALVGLTASSMGPREGADGRGGVVGWWNVSRRFRTAHAADARTVADLGRAISTDDQAYARDLIGQGYLGMRSQLASYHAAADGLPPELRGTPGSPWGLRLGAAAYSAGAGLVRALVSHYARELAPVAERDRWARLRELVARDARSSGGLGPYPWAGRWQLAHTILRSDERAESAAALARAVAPAELGYMGQLLSDNDVQTLAVLRHYAHG